MEPALTTSVSLTGPMLLKAILRNYGGRPVTELEQVVNIFFDQLGLPLPTSEYQVSS